VKKIILFGSAGQLGSKIKSIIHKESDCEFFDRKSCDIKDLKKVSKIISENPNSILINCAAYTKVDEAEIDKKNCLEINFDAVKNMVKLCNQFNLLFIHFSTDYVFNGVYKKPYDETDKHLPINFYGETKKLADEYILSNAKNFYIFRISWVYDKSGNNFLNTIKKLLMSKKDIKVVEDQYGIPTSTSFIAQIVEYFLYKLDRNKKEYGLYNCVPNGSCSWYQFACEIKKLLHEKNKLNLVNEEIIPIKTEDFNTRASRPMNSILKNNKLKNSVSLSIQDWTHYLKDEI
tara:strand:+ start:1810 stop:2676 length:867 start_codon:yes stop_codon:yes gene_type:complete